MLALQKSINGFDGQLAYFTRYNNLQFTPDVVGDMLLNGIASNITRTFLHQRPPGRWLIPGQPGQYCSCRFCGQRRKGSG